MLDFCDQVSAELAERPHIAVTVRAGGDGDESVVARCFALFGLFGLDHADQARGHEASDKGRIVHQHEHVDRIAIAAQG